MSDWQTVKELREELKDETEGLYMLYCSLGGVPGDTRVNFFMDDERCGVNFEDGKELSYLLYASFWGELLAIIEAEEAEQDKQ